MQAITTKYVGASATKSSRIKATCATGSITVSYDHDFDAEGAHKVGAIALCKKLGWSDYGRLIAGGTDGGYVFVFEPKATADLRNALGNLLQHVMGNRGNRDINPYCVPEVKNALQALHFDRTGLSGAEFSEYASAADSYANSTN